MNSETVKQTELSSPISAERELIGLWLYRFAWFIEICAVLIGLAIAIMQGLSSFSEMQLEGDTGIGINGYTNIFIAMMPFVMVALVEITKIPFAGAFYITKSRAWKTIFLFSLIFIAFITFESAANGFERNFTALTYRIDLLKKSLVAVEEQIPPLESRRENLSQLTSESIEEEYNLRYAELSLERANQSEVIQDRINSLRGSIQSEYADSLRDQISDRQTTVQIYRDERQAELARIQENADSILNGLLEEININRRSLQQQLAVEQEELNRLRVEKTNVVENSSIFTRTGRSQDYDERIEIQNERVVEARTLLNELNQSDTRVGFNSDLRNNIDSVNDEYEIKINEVNDEIQELSLELSQSVGARENDIEVSISRFIDELNDLEEAFSLQQNDISELRRIEYVRLDNNVELIDGLDQELISLTDERLDLRSQINTRVGDNQVYRMAQWWFGRESAADMERNEVIMVAAIWFGSLATLVAVTGILLALASYVIRDPSISDKNEGKRERSLLSNTVRSIRSFYISKKKILKQPIIKEIPKEVIREVPVEKIVKVEVPVEVIKKEIVHIPVYTDDKSLINIDYGFTDKE